MKQRSMVGVCLLLLAAVSAIMAVVAVYTFAKEGGEGVDAAYAWSAIILTVACGAWGFYFVRSPKADNAAEATPPAPMAPNK